MILNSRLINSLITTAQWHIDESFAIAALSGYIETIALLKSGNLSMANEAVATLSSNSGTSTPNSIGVLPYNGVMFLEDTYCETGALSYATELQAMYDNPNITSIVMPVNSGGGDSQAGYVVRDKVLEKNKPVYALVYNAGSAMYNAISGVDKIFMANESSRAGSIGSFFNMNKEAAKAYSATMEQIYAKQSTEKNAPIRAYLNGDKSLLEAEATQSAQQFIDSVVKVRPNINQTVFKGGMYYTSDAINLGLADGVAGSIESLLKNVAQSSTVSEGVLPKLNSEEMNFSKILKSLNSLFGWNLADNATQEEVEARLESQTPVASLISSAVTAQLATMNDAITSAQSKITYLTEQVSTLSGQTSTLTAQNSALTAQNATLSTDNTALQAEVLKLKALKPESNNNLADLEQQLDANLTVFTLKNEGKY